MRLKSRSGFSLIEAAIVLGVVGLIIGGIWVAAAAVSDANKINKTTLMIHQGLGDLDRLFGNQPLPTAGTDLTPLMISAGIIPADMVKNNLAYSEWGGLVAFEKLANANTVQVWLYSVPVKLCSKILLSITSPITQAAGGSKFQINIIYVGAGLPHVITPGAALAPETVMGWCNGVTSIPFMRLYYNY